MSAVVLERLRDLFLTGDVAAAARPARRVSARTAPATLGVLVGPGDAPAAGAALGLAAAAEHHAPCAVVCLWTGAETDELPRSGLASGAARRLAQRLAARGLTVGACGRVVTVALPASDSEARAATERALAAAGDLPLVLTVAGARPIAFDPLLANLDRLIVVPPSDAPAGLEGLAIDGAARLGRSAGLLRCPSAGAVTGRLLAVTGLPLSPAWRKAAAAALRGDDD